MNINKYFGQVIREERLKNKFSQEKLALKAGVDRTYITDIEKGERNISLIIAYKLSKALDVPFYKIFEKLK